MIETKCNCRIFSLKLDSSPDSAILDFPFIARRPSRVLPTSFTGDVTLKLAGTTGDEAALRDLESSEDRMNLFAVIFALGK